VDIWAIKSILQHNKLFNLNSTFHQ